VASEFVVVLTTGFDIDATTSSTIVGSVDVIVVFCCSCCPSC
jgi:hypothetical protein